VLPMSHRDTQRADLYEAMIAQHGLDLEINIVREDGSNVKIKSDTWRAAMDMAIKVIDDEEFVDESETVTEVEIFIDYGLENSIASVHKMFVYENLNVAAASEINRAKLRIAAALKALEDGDQRAAFDALSAPYSPPHDDDQCAGEVWK